MRNVAVLGATGSIGASALDVIARHPDRLRATVLAAGRNVEALVALCVAHRPLHAVIADFAGLPALQAGLRAAGLPTQAHAGDEVLDALVASDACDTVVAAIVGAAGMASTLAAARAGKRLLLANKESLVLAGELLMATATRAGAAIVPIDSEHNAIFQCLPGDYARGLAQVGLGALAGHFGFGLGLGFGGGQLGVAAVELGALGAAVGNVAGVVVVDSSGTDVAPAMIVVVVGVVVEHDEPLRPRAAHEPQALLPGGVAPAAVARILLVGVGGVVDHGVSGLAKRSRGRVPWPGRWRGACGRRSGLLPRASGVDSSGARRCLRLWRRGP